MGKGEFSAFGDDFLTSAGKWFMTTMDIKEMKAKEKRLREETTFKSKEAKAKEKLEIAKMLYKSRQKKREAAVPLRGKEFKAQKEAEILDAYLTPIKDKVAKGEKITQEDLDNVYMFRAYRKADVVGKYTKPEPVEALDKKISDLINKVSTSSPNRDKFVALQGVASEEELEEIWKLHRSELPVDDMYGGTQDRFDAAYRYLKERFRKRGSNVPAIEEKPAAQETTDDELKKAAEDIVNEYFQ